MVLKTILILDVISVIFQLLATIIAYKIYVFNKFNKWWLALVFAFFLQTIRRLVTSIEDFGIVSIPSYGDADRLLMVVISLFMFIGLYALWRSFNDFDLAKIKIDNKVKSFMKKK